jgi:uncharacterized protein
MKSEFREGNYDTDSQLILQTQKFVKEKLLAAEGGHDWFHILRVYNLALRIGTIEAQSQPVNMTVVKLGALLHDIADSKFHEGDEEIGPMVARAYLESKHVDSYIVEHVEQIIRNISFKGGKHTQNFHSIELAVVQDADRLDAMGAIGIARTFNFGGFKGRALYDPDIPPNLDMTKAEYKTASSPTLNHFYEKLLLLKNRMNTNSGKQLAEHRHTYMEQFLTEFYEEWNGER